MIDQTSRFSKPNLLGSLVAESDPLLHRVFLATADYRTLIETTDRIVVVGRRGTGKSAISIRLRHNLVRDRKVATISISPEEHQMIGFRPLVGTFAPRFMVMRSAARIIWRYAFLVETAGALSPIMSFRKTSGFPLLQRHFDSWAALGNNIVDRTRRKLSDISAIEGDPEVLIAELPRLIEIDEVEAALKEGVSKSDKRVVFLIDRLDEGFEPDDRCVALVDGLVQACIDLRVRKVVNVQSIVFLRDNIFRAIQQMDPDYVRSIEGRVLRLHWDEADLFTLTCARIKEALSLEVESSEKIWNSVVAGELKGRKGFRSCLQLTLYRPRDIVSLLNESFYAAGRKNQSLLALQHVKYAARGISQVRLDDLNKEYSRILPGLDRYVGAFRGRNPECTIQEAIGLIEDLLSKGDENVAVQQDFLILEDARSVLKALYSIGFIGVQLPELGTFVFCHDGRFSNVRFEVNDKILIHPCYWIALDAKRSLLDVDAAEEIYDEYEIEISSENPEIRVAKINQLIDRLKMIPEGQEGAADFEEWCERAIRIAFAGGLSNVELRPNRNAKSRRDIVATNLGEDGVWRRVYEDYGTRQVIFEVKNYHELQPADYRQISFYLDGHYGKIGFLVTRRDETNLRRGKDLDWVREVYNTQDKKLVILLTGRFLSNLLGKLKQPQKHNEPNRQLHKILDQYTRRYLVNQT